MALDKDQSGNLDHQEMEELAVWIYTSTTKDVQQDSQEKVQHVDVPAQISDSNGCYR